MDSNNKIITKNQKLVKILDDLVEKALDELYTKDSYLLENEVHERTIVFRFGLYLQVLMDKSKKFNEYNLDFEYNRNGNDPKMLSILGSNVIPDLIIHRRGSNDHNLLVVEFKTYWNSDTRSDLEKLSGFMSKKEPYKYIAGKSIVLSKNRATVEIQTLSSLQNVRY